MKFQKLVPYPFGLCGSVFKEREFSITKILSKKDRSEVARAIELGQIKEIGGGVLSNSKGNAELDKVKSELAEALAELAKGGNDDEIVNDIMTMTQKNLRLKYAKTETVPLEVEADPQVQK